MTLKAYDMMVANHFPKLGGGGGGGGEATSTAYTNMIPDYIPGFQAWTEAYLSEAQALAGGNFYPYTGTTYAPQNANETDGIAAVAVRGRLGSQVELDGKAHLRDLYDGLKINQNDKLDDFLAAKIEELVEEFEWEVLPSIRNSYVMAFGGSEHNVAEAKAASAMMKKINDFARMYYDDYKSERDLQEQAMIHATPYGLQCIRDMEMLRTAGVYEREYEQGALGDAWDSFNEAQVLPMRNLDIYGNAVRTILSTYREQTVTYHKPPLIAQIAGVAMTGLALYSMFSGTSLNPYGKGQASTDKAFSQVVQQPGGFT